MTIDSLQEAEIFDHGVELNKEDALIPPEKPRTRRPTERKTSENSKMNPPEQVIDEQLVHRKKPNFDKALTRQRERIYTTEELEKPPTDQKEDIGKLEDESAGASD